MSLISKIICYLYKDDRKKMINICLNFVKSFQEIIDEQELKKRSNFFEIYFFIMFIVIRRYFRKRNKMIAEYQVDLFIKVLFYHIWLTYIENNREVATQMFDLSNFVSLENMTLGNLFAIFTKKLTDRIEYYSYCILSDMDDKSYKKTIKSFIDLVFGFKLNDSESESLRLLSSTDIISNAIDITEKFF